MSIAEALAGASQRLRLAGVPSPAYDAEELLAHLLSVPRQSLPRREELTDGQASAYADLVARRERREPLQHIVGRAAFRYVELEVGPGVFVPRPETEVLVGWAVDVLAELAAAGRSPLAVDLCTGSGAAALAMATEVPTSSVYAVELASSAYAYAERNLADTGVHLRLGDIADALPELDGQVDVVVANPPYIPLEAYESVDAEARAFEPPVALWSGADGLAAIRVVEATARRLVRPGGRVGCEHADVQGGSAPSVFSSSGGWTEVRDRADLAGRPRFVTARRVRLAP